MKKSKNRSTGLSAFPSGEPAIMRLPDMQDGRNKEWQDRGRVNMDHSDPTEQTNIERDFEQEHRDPKERGEDQKFY